MFHHPDAQKSTTLDAKKSATLTSDLTVAKAAEDNITCSASITSVSSVQAKTPP